MDSENRVEGIVPLQEQNQNQANGVKPGSTAAQLVSTLTNFRKEQELQRVAAQRMSSMSMMLSVSNYARSLKIEEEQEHIKNQLVKGFSLVKEMQKDISSNSNHLETVDKDLKAHEVKVSGLNDKVDSLETKYSKELEEHRKLLTEQRMKLTKMTISMFKQDATIDASILLIVWVIVNAPVIDFPLRIASTATSSLPILPLSKAKRHIVVGQASKLLVFLTLSRALRVMAVKRGWHNCVGGPESYFLHVLKYFSSNKKES
mmetsp:Transcript_10915/g.12597  ORF Transcript_10915/g.12597 Transcript_10915/m.12597 type:complete len:260 (+) Transcript_10915:91-870(+)